MITFSFGVLFLLVAAACVIVGRKIKAHNTAAEKENERRQQQWKDGGRLRYGSTPPEVELLSPWIHRLVGVVAAILGLSMIAGAVVEKVPVRNVGIVVSYGKPTGRTTGAGLHLVKPWETIEDWDATRQNFDRRTNNDCRLGDQKFPGVKVRIANLSDACVETQVEWKTRERRAPEQWGSYRNDFNRFVDRRVTPAFTEAFNLAFATHDPLLNIDAKDGKLNVPLDPFAVAAKTSIETKVGSDVEILSVIITRVNYDPKTQAQIDQYQQAILKGRVLEKDKRNAELAKSVSETNAQVDKQTRCLELAKELNKEPGYCMWTNGFPAAK